jgi:hypothetical protein
MALLDTRKSWSGFRNNRPEGDTLALVKRRDSIKALSAVTAHALFPSVLAHAAEAAAGLDTPGAAWTPTWVRPERAAMLEALVDTILPATGTPGARQARVQVFVDLALRDCYTPAEQKLFVDGLEALAREGQARHGRPFEACSPEERHALLVPLDAASYAPDTGARGSFVRAAPTSATSRRMCS